MRNEEMANILYVDDEFTHLRSLLKIVEGMGHTLLPINDPGLAVFMFMHDPNEFDIVITDMRMPKMNGVRLLENLKEIRPDLPIILYSGSTELTPEDARALGFRTFLRKPVRSAEMADAIRRALLPPIPANAGRGPVRVTRTFYPPVERIKDSHLKERSING